MGFSRRRLSYHAGTMRALQPQNIHEAHWTDGERSSVRSSDDGQSASPGGDERERQRLIEKMDTARERLKVVSLQRAGDVEEFLALTKEAEAQRGADNPQMARIRQNFEKKNKRHAHDTENLQKKLGIYEARLEELENGGAALDTSNRSNVMSTVGQGIRRTGANIKGMTESVMAAPMELAHKIKNTFGSADNVNEANNGDDSRVGHSVFYADSEHGGSTHGTSKPSKSSTLPAGMKMDLTGTPSRTAEDRRKEEREEDVSRLSDPSFLMTSTPNPLEETQLVEEFRRLRRHLQKIENKCDDITVSLRSDLRSEVADLNRTLDEERFRSKKLEDLLNETIELHQAEYQSLKLEQKTIANRLDYQYNDRFRTVEETVEAVQNQMIRMENSIKQTLDLRLGGSSWGGGNTVLLSGVNILLELLKIFLYVIATVLDIFRPFTGSRSKAGVLLLIVVSLFLFFNYVDVSSLLPRTRPVVAPPPTAAPDVEL